MRNTSVFEMIQSINCNVLIHNGYSRGKYHQCGWKEGLGDKLYKTSDMGIH